MTFRTTTPETVDHYSIDVPDYLQAPHIADILAEIDLERLILAERHDAGLHAGEYIPACDGCAAEPYV